MRQLRPLHPGLIEIELIRGESTSAGVIVPEPHKVFPSVLARVVAVHPDLTAPKVGDVIHFRQHAYEEATDADEVEHRFIGVNHVFCVLEGYDAEGAALESDPGEVVR